MKYTAYISIGSNLGNKLENCEKAVRLISKLNSTTLITASKWYINPALTTDPSIKHPDFLNGVIKIRTQLSAGKLLRELQDIEAAKGRHPNHSKWSPRTIDLDILFFDDQIINSETLTIPHPELHKRNFVLEPLCDIEPNLMHPILMKSIKELLQILKEDK